ncbi:hypothetical protein SAMN04488514_109126 [Kriegella aquimaris]|uniref:Uncharacterized protein n=1 Tax=Kriegella aquimaris TaxID=192904 RepID=A0A1G9TMH9_9FLAO|nr:hypothetical protein SAMN04488514_109126 [Kriegella aquimaris]
MQKKSAMKGLKKKLLTVLQIISLVYIPKKRIKLSFALRR